MSNNTSIFRLLKVPKYAKRTVAGLCERKSEALAEEVGRLKREWMEKEREIERLRRELGRVEGELKKKEEVEGEGGGYGYGPMRGQGKSWSVEEEEDLETLWRCYGPTRR